MFSSTLLTAVSLGFACVTVASAPPGPTCDPKDPTPCPDGLVCEKMDWFSMGITTVGSFCVLPTDGSNATPESSTSTSSLIHAPTVAPTTIKPTGDCGSEEPSVKEYAKCGGHTDKPFECDEGSSCMDDPRVEFGCGTACDMPGICIPDTVPTCGGFMGLECPAGTTCYDDPKLDCDSKEGGADCPGVCL